MEYIRILGELIANPLLDFLMAFVGMLIVSLLMMLLQLAFFKLFKSKLQYIELFGFKFSKPEQGKWEYRGHRNKFGFEAAFNFDLKACAGMDNKKMVSYEYGFILTSTISCLIISVIICAVCWINAFRISPWFAASFVFLTGFWTLMFGCGRLVVALISIAKTSSKKTLGGYASQAYGMLRSGIPYERMDLRPVRELNFRNVWDAEKITYFPIYFAYLDANGKYDLMPEAVAGIESILKPGNTSKPYLIVYFYLVFYYSYHYIVPSKAKEYYHRAGDAIARDKDSDGMCLKGFYELNCFGNVEKAKECAAAAVAKIEDYPSAVEKEYWRNNIAKLNNAINNFRG